MEKRILATVLFLVCLLGLTACTEDSEETKTTIFSSKYVNLEVVEDMPSGEILVDQDTGVLYLLYRNCLDGTRSQTLTPIYNADGSLKNIEDFE